MREIRLYDSLSGEFVPVSAGDAIRVEVRGLLGTDGYVDVESTRPLVLFSFLERFLRREGFTTKFLFDSPDDDDKLYEIAEGREAPVSGAGGAAAGERDAELDGERSAEGDGGRSVEGDGQRSVEGDGQRSVEGDGQRSAEGDGQRSAEGDGQRSAEGDGQRSVEGDGQRSAEGDGQRSAEGDGQRSAEGDGQRSVEGDGQRSVEGDGQRSAEGDGQRSVEGDGQQSAEQDGQQSAEQDGEQDAEMSLLEVQRSDVEQWVNVCFGAGREGAEHGSAASGERVLLSHALEEFGHSAVALYLLGTHYSLPLGDAHAGLIAGSRNASSIRKALGRLVPDQPSPPDMRHYVEDFRDALADDLDTPTAFVVMFEWLLEAERRGGDVGDNDLRVMLEVFELEDLATPTRVS